jgi:hypothetical protein
VVPLYIPEERESYFSGYCMQKLFSGKEKVSLLERGPHFRGGLREGSSFQGWP